MLRGMAFVLSGAITVIVFGGCDQDVSDPAGPGSKLIATAGPATDFRTVPDFPENPEGFVETIDNPYLPLQPGYKWTYEGETDEGTETIVVEVLSEKKEILGISATIVHDQAFLEGQLIENTYDWFAQDTTGNVWYLGEYSEEIENDTVVSTEGSWEAGVDGAEAGIVMLANPVIGLKYRQEYYEDEAEDMGMVLSLSASVLVPYGSFTNVLRTMEWTPLEPGAREFKYYVAGIGLVLEVAPSGGRQRIELTQFED